MSLPAQQKRLQPALWPNFIVSLFYTILSLFYTFSLAAEGRAWSGNDDIFGGSLPYLSAVESCTEKDDLATATVQTNAGVHTAVVTLQSARFQKWTVHQVIPGEVASLFCSSEVTAEALVLTRAGHLWKGAVSHLKLLPKITPTGAHPLLARWFSYAPKEGCLRRVKSLNSFITPGDCPPEQDMRTHILLVATDNGPRPQTFFQVLNRQGQQVWTSLSPQGEFQALATAGSLPGSPALGKHDVVVLEINPVRRTSTVLHRVGSAAEEEAALFGFNADLEVVIGGQTAGAVSVHYGGHGDAFLALRNSRQDWTVQLGSTQSERFDTLFLTGDYDGPLQGTIFGQAAGRPAIWTFRAGTDHLTRMPVPVILPAKELNVFRLANEKTFLIVGIGHGRVSWTRLPFSP